VDNHRDKHHPGGSGREERNPHDPAILWRPGSAFRFTVKDVKGTAQSKWRSGDHVNVRAPPHDTVTDDGEVITLLVPDVKDDLREPPCQRDA